MLKLSSSSLLRNQAFIDGEWRDAHNSGRFAVVNPADGNVITEVAAAGAIDTRSAIAVADKALDSWQQHTAKERSAIMRRWFQLIMEHQNDLAAIMTAEQGKPLAEARSEVAYGASFIEWFAEEAKRVYGDVIPAPANDRRIVTLKQPVGVVAAITPWNFPIAMVTRKAGPALAAGCTMVLKPARETPLSALALAELGQRAGLPPGVLNVVAGPSSSEIGGTLCNSPLVRKLTFTGSTGVGKLLMKQCADTVKKTSMELGGNAPFIVFDDADLDAAVAGAMTSKYRNAGQTCVCANRIMVQDGIFDRFADKLAAAVAGLKVGDGTANDVNIGPLISRQALEDVSSLVNDALAQGARALIGGTPSTTEGNFYPPTVLTDVRHGMRVFHEEIFGPVAPLFRFRTEAEAVAMANDTEFGLASYFYSRNLSRCWRVAERLEYGIVGINEGMISTEVAPFGGIKESGIGREGSKYGLDDYLEIKYLCLGGLAG